MNFKTIAFWVGAFVLVGLALRFAKKNILRDVLTPRSQQSDKQKALDDNAPVATYAWIVPPIAQNVYPNAALITMKRNDSVVPPQYALPAIGPNGNT